MNELAVHPCDNISLCAGGGGLDLAVELAIGRARTVCMVEREAYAARVLVSAMEAGLLAPCPIWSDARTFNGRDWRGLVDGLFGGIPCQPHSETGKQLGAEDERDLWEPARRIIVQARPWWVLIENVGGMVWSGGFERIFRDLQRLGYEVEAGLFTAEECGDSQERERLFILAVARADRLGPPFDLCEGGDAREEQPTASRSGRQVVGADRGMCDGRPDQSERGPSERTPACRPSPPTVFPPGPDDIAGWIEYLQIRPDLEPAVRKRTDGLATRIEQLRLLGNGVVPVEGAYAFRYLATSLALRGSLGAARLVRMMEAA